MLGIETLLPEDRKLESTIVDCAELVEQELRDIKRNSLFGDIIDWTIVDADAETFTANLSQVIGFENPDEGESMTRGMLFARQVLNMIYGVGTRVRMPEYFLSGEEVEVTRANIHNDTQEYLIKRPKLDDFIRWHMGEIDKSKAYPDKVEEVCALIFMSGEVWLAEEHMRRGIERLTNPDFMS